MKIKGSNSIEKTPGITPNFVVINSSVKSMFIDAKDGKQISPVALEADVPEPKGPRPSTMKPLMR